MIFEGELIFDCLDDSGSVMTTMVDSYDWPPGPRTLWVEFHSVTADPPDEEGLSYRESHPELNDLVGKTVRVAVEVIDEI